MNLKEEITQAFNMAEQWHFIKSETIELKFFVSKQVDLQVFKINGKSANIGFNYGSKAKTKQAIFNNLGL